MTITKLLIIHLIELVAAICGTIYCYHNTKDKSARYFTYFLWLTVVVETFGLLPRIILKTELLPNLRGTFLQSNYWLYNIFLIITIPFYLNYVKWNLTSSKTIKFISYLTIFFVVTSIINFLCTDVFFKQYSSYSYITGTFYILMVAGFYFYEVLQSDILLKFNRTLPFYVVFGTLFFHLCMTPLYIYGKYYSFSKSPFFVEVHTTILTIVNVLLYGCYILGFIICLKKKKSY